jgi:hypothetical protein
MPQFGIFETAVVVDDLELPEYCTKTDHDAKTVTCWIPSEAGKVRYYKNLQTFYLLHSLLLCKEFKVKCRTIEPVMVYPDMKIGGFVKVDGKKGGSTWIGEMGGETVYVSEVVTSATTYRRVMFSSIELTGEFISLTFYCSLIAVDDDAFLNDERAKDLGDITFSIHLVTCEGVVPTVNTELHDSDGKVHERSKKAMVHRVKCVREFDAIGFNYMIRSQVRRGATVFTKYDHEYKTSPDVCYLHFQVSVDW